MNQQGSEAFEPYEGIEPYLFISYSHMDKIELEKVKDIFNKSKIRYWYDDGLHSGDDWNRMIAEHLQNAWACLLLLSPNAAVSEYVKNELNFAIRYRIPIHILLLKDFQLPPDIEMMTGRIQMVEMQGDFSKKLLQSFPEEVFYSIIDRSEIKTSDCEPPISSIDKKTDEGDIKTHVDKLIYEKYEIIDKLSSELFCDIYLATNRMTNGKCFIKVINKHEDCFGTFRHRLSRELSFFYRMSHPGLPSVFDVIEDSKVFLVVVEYMDGISLEQFTKENGVQQEDVVIEWAKQLCDMVCYLHIQESMDIHNNIHPQTVIIKENGEIALTDFGDAFKELFTDAANERYLISSAYAAPESNIGLGKMDKRTEIYSIGATLYFLVTEKEPLEQIPIRQINPHISYGLEYIIEKCMKPEPKERYQTVHEILLDLNNVETLSLKLKKKRFMRKIFLFGSRE